MSEPPLLNLQGPVTFTLDSRKFEYVDQPVAAAAAVRNSAKATRTNAWAKVVHDKETNKKPSDTSAASSSQDAIAEGAGENN